MASRLEASRKEVVDRHVHQTGVGAVEKALDQSDQETLRREPLKARQHLLQEAVHVQGLWRDEPIGHADNKRDRRTGGECPGNYLDVLHDVLLVMTIWAAGGRGCCGSCVFSPCWLCLARVAATVALRPMSAMSAVASMPEQVHRHERDAEKYPDPVLC